MKSVFYFLSIDNPMPIFRSIRWRLIASFTLLTLLTITLLGVLVLSLMQRYVARQEVAYLHRNAVALAQQSELFFAGSDQPAEIRSLVETAALLGNFQVKILDKNERIVVDTEQPSQRDRLMWILPAPALGAPDAPAPDHTVITEVQSTDIFFIPPELPIDVVEPGRAFATPSDSQPGRLAPEPPGAPYAVRIIRQTHGSWGPHLQWEIAPGTPDSDSTRTEAITLTHTLPALPLIEPSIWQGGKTTVITQPIPAERRETWRALRQRFLWNWLRSERQQQVIAPIESDADVVGYVELINAPGVASEALAALRQLFLLAAASVSVVAVAVGLVISRSLTAPIGALTAATDQMIDGDLSARAGVRSNDEIGHLARSFNRMAGALEASFGELAAERDALRNFVADASHELRTPITALRTFNALLRHGTEKDAAARSEFLRESNAQLLRLERITENLLNLSRLDGGLIELEREEVNVNELFTHVVEMLRPLAQERQVTLLLEQGPEHLALDCDYAQVERALINLVDNALKFTPAGGTVTVGAATMDTQTCIWVQDTGVGIAAEDQARIFHRFHRGRNSDSEGSGLGLAIVQSVMDAHGGTVTVESEEGEGSRFTICVG